MGWQHQVAKLLQTLKDPAQEEAAKTEAEALVETLVEGEGVLYEEAEAGYAALCGALATSTAPFQTGVLAQLVRVLAQSAMDAALTTPKTMPSRAHVGNLPLETAATGGAWVAGCAMCDLL